MTIEPSRLEAAPPPPGSAPPSAGGAEPSQIVRGAAWLVVVFLTVYILRVAKELLVPFVVALIIWYVINTLTLHVERLRFFRRQLPRGVAFALALLVIGLAAVGIGNLVGVNLSQVAEAAPTYQRNLEHWFVEALRILRLDEPPRLDQLTRNIDLADLISESAAAVANLAGNTGLVALYLLFLFVEERAFPQKLAALVPDPVRRAELDRILAKISADTRHYVGLKTLMSLLTALLSYLLMRLVGLDYSEFWALMIFLLNFIPNIGSVIATSLPALLALVQFDRLTPFLVVAGGITVVQAFVGNILEPRLMGRSLNLSPLAIVLALVFWGTVWGLIGMFLCVPIMVILVIVFARFPQTRPVAVLLSEDGQLTE